METPGAHREFPFFELFYGPRVIMGRGKIKIKVGVGVGKTKMGVNRMGGRMIPPLVAVGVGVGATAVAAFVGVEVGAIGVGGAAIDGSVSGMQAAEVTDPAIQAKPPLPPANSIYHHVPSKFFPATLAVPPCGMLPITL
jgi:hypothetical protein